MQALTEIKINPPFGNIIDLTILKWEGINFTPGIEFDQRMPQEPKYLMVSPFAIYRLHQMFRYVAIEHTMEVDTTDTFDLSFEAITN